MKLHAKIVGSGKPMVVLHGLFGSGDNWITMANTFASKGFEVHLLDLRNHGRSPHDPVFNYRSMAEDLQRYLQENSLKDVVLIGHSMGGKTVLQHVSMYPSTAVAAIVVDITPYPFVLRHGHVIDALKAVDFRIHTTRKSVEAALRSHLDDEGTCQLLLKGLYWVADDKLAWRFDVDAIGASIHEVGAEVDTTGLAHIPFLFVRGSESDYITDENVRTIRAGFPHVKFVTIQGAGHRVHADRPAEFVQAVEEFLGR